MNAILKTAPRVVAILSLALAGAMARSAQAAPLAPGDVAADSKWVIHFDLDAAHQSKIAEHLREKVMQEHPHAQKVHDWLKNELNFDPHQDLHGVTLYGKTLKDREGVLLVYAKLDQAKIVEFLKKQADYKESTEGSNTFYSWTSKLGKPHPVVACFAKDGLVVLASNADKVKAALAVTGGTGGLSSNSPLAVETYKGTTVHVAATGLTPDDFPEKADIARKISQVSLMMGESDEKGFTHLSLEVADEKTAEGIRDVLTGFRAMGLLHADKLPNGGKILEGVKIGGSGKTVTLDSESASDDVIKAVDAACERMKAHEKKLGERLKERMKERRGGDSSGEKKR